MSPSAEIIAALVGASAGGRVSVLGVDRVGAWAVWRARLEIDDQPASVIVKGLRRNDIAFRTDPRQIANEAAALTFLQALGFTAAPRLVASSLDDNLLLLEDLVRRTPLDEQLRQRGAASLGSERLAFARTMGALAGATAGRRQAWDDLRSRYGEPDPTLGLERGLGPLWERGRPLIEAAGLTLSAAVEDDLVRALGLIAEPGPFLAMTNGDPEPNNFLCEGVDGRLIDFEVAAYRNALTAATWFTTPGPAWMVVADPIALDLEAEFRKALAVNIPLAGDDGVFGQHIVAANLVWALERLARLDTLDRRPPGEPSRPQMISTLEAAAAVGRRWRALPQLTGWVEGAAAFLRRRWPDADIDLAALAPYTARA